MERFAILLMIIEYIEEHLTEDITQEDIAEECSYSMSSLQKMFSKVFHIGIADYINRRKITAASRDLLNTNDNILDIALRYGYNSHEVFSRAFVRVRGGGDEFVLLTNKTDEKEAIEIINRIFSHNGEIVIHNGVEHPISLHDGIIKLNTENGLKYDQPYTDIIETVKQHLRGNIIKLDTEKVRFGKTFTELGNVLGY